MRSLSPIRLIALLAAALSGCDLRFQEGSHGSMPEDLLDKFVSSPEFELYKQIGEIYGE